MTLEELEEKMLIVSIMTNPKRRKISSVYWARRFAASQVEQVFNSVNINTYTEARGVLRVTADLAKYKKAIIKELTEGL